MPCSYSLIGLRNHLELVLINYINVHEQGIPILIYD